MYIYIMHDDYDYVWPNKTATSFDIDNEKYYLDRIDTKKKKNPDTWKDSFQY